MVVIPAIDLRHGRCVRLIQGDAERVITYADDPTLMAARWVQRGARWLHVVDLDGALAGRPAQLDLVRVIVQQAGVPVQLGGGFRTADDVEAGLATGAARVIVGTAAFQLGEKLTSRYGERVAVAVDVKAGRVAVKGWTEVSDLDPITLGRGLVAQGVGRFVYTDVARDGMLAGPDLTAVHAFMESVGVPVIAAGGIASNDDVTALARLGVEGVIVGRALYEGRVDLSAHPANSNSANLRGPRTC